MRASAPQRLKKRADFLRVAREGRKAAFRSTVVQVHTPPAATSLRVGFTATKKIGNAVARNRTKRRLREALRLTVSGQPCQLADVVLIGRAATRDLAFDALLTDVHAALRKLGVLH